MITLRPPAKVNLLLKVLFPRPDGYHELRTVFQTIGLCDELRLSPRPDGALTLACDAPGVPVDDSNLCLRAARLLREKTGVRQGARLELAKAIPAQGGLGGGSADAAAALAGLNRLWSAGASPADLAEWGAELGADVPFFLTGGTALGVGRGDEIVPLPDLPPLWVAAVLPQVSVNTSWAYGQLNLGLTKEGTGNRIHRLHGVPQDLDALVKTAENDFEPVVFQAYPELAEYRQALFEVGAHIALMSGSGSTVFGLFPGEEAARKAADGLRRRWPGLQVLTAGFVSRPEHQALLGLCGSP